MIVEATEPLRVVIEDSGETIRLKPYVPTDLPETYALKLLTKASDTVRVFKPVVPEDLQPGTTISWQSPLFGRVQGEVAMLPEGGWLVVRCHSVTGDLALVKLDWHIRIEGNAKND